ALEAVAGQSSGGKRCLAESCQQLLGDRHHGFGGDDGIALTHLDLDPAHARLAGGVEDHSLVLDAGEHAYAFSHPPYEPEAPLDAPAGAVARQDAELTTFADARDR